IGKLSLDLAAHLAKGVIGNADAAGLGDALQPRCNVHPITEDVLFLNDHIAEIDADPKSDALVLWDVGIAIGHPSLQFGSASDGVHNAGKLGEEAVARVLDSAPAVLPDLRINQLVEVRLEAFVRAFLVRPHQPRIPR